MWPASRISVYPLLLCVPVLLVVLGVAVMAPSLHVTAVVKKTPTPQAAPRIFPRADFVALTHQQHDIGSDFAAFYHAHQGATWLGAAITTELPINAGQEQFFQGGVLRADSGGTVNALPIATTLIGAGAEIPLAAPTATLNYAALAPATGAANLTTAPWWWRADGDPAVVGDFVGQGTRQHQVIGYYIPALFAAFLTQLGDWQALVGAPITEATSSTAWIDGAAHHIVAQAFARVVLLYDRDAPGAAHVTTQPGGADYLAIYGPPPLNGADGRSAWTVGASTAILAGPGSGTPIATFYTPVAVTLAGDSVWFGGVLWYHIVWKNLTTQQDGWLTADQVSFTAPPNAGPQIADLAALTPQLGAFAQQQGNSAAVAVYVPDLNRYYVYNQDAPMVMASTFKVPILLTLLSQAEGQGRGLTGDEQAAAQSMIENSDNDAATTLYAEIGYNTGIDQFMASAGLALTVNTAGFGDSTITPLAMTQLLDDLRAGRFLSPADRQYALSLLGNVAPGQQMGVGAAAPAGAGVAMKDGWIGENSGWVTDSVGIVTANGHSYVIAVYVAGHANIGDGWNVVNTICHDVSVALLGR